MRFFECDVFELPGYDNTEPAEESSQIRLNSVTDNTGMLDLDFWNQYPLTMSRGQSDRAFPCRYVGRQRSSPYR